MPQPYNYNLNLPNPVEAVLQGVAIRQQFEQQRAQAQRQQQQQADIQALQADPSPQKFADFYLKYPEMKAQLDAYRTTLADADKQIMTNASRELMGAVTAGRADLVDQSFDKWITGLKESGRTDLVSQFEEAKRFYSLDPKAGEFAIHSMFQSLDPDGYKALAGGGDPLDKQYTLDVQLYGPEEATRLRYAQRMAQGTVTATGPAGTTYRWMGGAPPQTKVLNGKTYFQRDGKWFEGEPTIENTPPPQLGANGMPSVLTRQQYQAIVQAKGKEATDAWVERNNVTVEGM